LNVSPKEKRFNLENSLTAGRPKKLDRASVLTQSSNVVPELGRQIFETISEFSPDQIWRPDTTKAKAIRVRSSS